MPLKRGSSQPVLSANIRTLKREHPDWAHKRVVAAALNNARRTKRRARRNPSDPAVTYWVVLASIVVGGVAIWGWKHMTDAQKAKALPGL